jgi:tetratricopeptide (TPR) repeat protein
MRGLHSPSRWHKVIFLAAFSIALSGTEMAFASASERLVKAKVKVIIEKLPLDRQQKMRGFDELVKNYINNYDWLKDEDVDPIELTVQLFLETAPSSGEDRYRCQILIASGDIQYFDRRARFAYQKGDPLPHDLINLDSVTPLLDFYIYLVLANELDKYGYLMGTPYFEKARNVLETAKFGRFTDGWDIREVLIRKIFREPYKKFRELKDYYFYGLSVWDEDIKQAREYIGKAIEQLAEVMREDSNIEAAKQFIDAHYQEIIDLFQDAPDRSIFDVMIELDPGRKDLYTSVQKK